MGCSRTTVGRGTPGVRSNNTNKWDAQEQKLRLNIHSFRSNNTNKWDAQELIKSNVLYSLRSNNTNKWDAQELLLVPYHL